MKQEKFLIDKFGRDTGMKTPPGFLDDVYSSVNAARKPIEFPKPERKTLWQSVRPYIYLAAMFAGIWCMMKMFSMMSDTTSSVSLNNMPEAMAKVIQNHDVYTDVSLARDLQSTPVSDYEISQSLEDEYSDFNEFESDFGYEFTDDYADLDGISAEPAASAHSGNK